MATEDTHGSAHTDQLVCLCGVCEHARALTCMAGGSSVSCATTVAAECIPRLRAEPVVLTVIRNTPNKEGKDSGRNQTYRMCC